MAWIGVHQNLKDHPKTLDLMNIMDWDLDTSLAKLLRFWLWCVDYAEDGDLRKHNDARLAVAVGLDAKDGKRFVEGMVQSGWIDRDPYFRVHEWWEYFGKFLQTRYKQTPEKYQRIKNMYDCSNTVQITDNITQPNTTQPNLTKKEICRFSPPIMEDVKKYCLERKNGVDYVKWHNFYSAKNWMIGKNKMKDWQAAVRTWEQKKEEVKEWPKHPKNCTECFGNGYIIAPGSGGKFSCREKY